MSQRIQTKTTKMDPTEWQKDFVRVRGLWALLVHRDMVGGHGG
jgi:hypothetical protein